MAVAAAPAARTSTKLNSNQIKGFWAAWGGWTLDGMDAFIYALVLVPALTELLPRSGIAVDAGQHRVLRQHPAGAVPARMGPVDGLGPDCRPLRPRPRADADDPLLFGLHLHVRTGDQHLAARRPARAVRHRSRRRAADGRHVRRRGVARGSPQDGRRATCTPATTSASSSRRSPTTSSARTTAGAGCSSSAARRRCWSAGSRAACASRRPGRRRRRTTGSVPGCARRSPRCSRRSTGAARSSTRCCSPCRSSGCGPGRSTCRPR